jgi:hypothetical protein
MDSPMDKIYTLLQELLPDVLPWTRFLPAADRYLLVREFIDMTKAAASVDNCVTDRSTARRMAPYRRSACRPRIACSFVDTPWRGPRPSSTP